MYNPRTPIRRTRAKGELFPTLGQTNLNNHLTNVVGSQGNTPGFPNATKNVDFANQPTIQTTEQIKIVSTNNSPVTLVSRQPFMTYQAMIDDVPFDAKSYQKLNENLAMLGGFATVLGYSYLSR